MNLYRVGTYMEDEFVSFTLCTTMEYANKAKKLLENGGWENIEIEAIEYGLNKIVLDGETIDLTV